MFGGAISTSTCHDQLSMEEKEVLSTPSFDKIEDIIESSMEAEVGESNQCELKIMKRWSRLTKI